MISFNNSDHITLLISVSICQVRFLIQIIFYQSYNFVSSKCFLILLIIHDQTLLMYRVKYNYIFIFLKSN